MRRFWLQPTDQSTDIRAAKVALELGKISGGKVTAIYVADTEQDEPSAG